MSLATMENIAQVMAGPSADCLLAYYEYGISKIGDYYVTIMGSHVVKITECRFSTIVVVGQRICDEHNIRLFDHSGSIHRGILKCHSVLLKHQHILSHLRPSFIRLHIELLAECIGVVQCLRYQRHREATSIDVICVFILVDC